MPKSIRGLLVKKGLVKLYKACLLPGKTIIWDGFPKQKGLDQMLDELQSGDLYMKMAGKG